MDKRLMHCEFPRDQIQLEGTMAELPGKVAAVVEDSTDAAIVAAILAAARAEGVTDLYLLDKTFILDAIREKKERENPRPLTLEELRGMKAGEVIWHESLQGLDGCWIVLRNHDIKMFQTEITAIRYGKTWTAYRHKPKEDPHGK